MSNLSRFDPYLTSDDVAALVIREHLEPAEGPDAVFFPPTFAGIGYNIDGTGDDSVCIVDTVGSQANRIEPRFAQPPLSELVPQITIKAGERVVNLLEAGHRAGDAIVRCTRLGAEIQKAFQAHLRGDATPLAKLAPTSLVFGVWDSRDTQDKLPRLVASTIRAYGVRKLTRSAQYNPPVDYSQLEVFSEEEKAKAEGKSESPLAQRGFVHVPSTGSHGGITAREIRRDAILALAALRLLHAGTDTQATLKLRRYILSLALLAFTQPAVGYLRQGCVLVPAAGKPAQLQEVHANGQRKPLELKADDLLAYAKAAAADFGVGPSHTVEFDKKLAKDEVAKTKESGKKSRG